MSVKLNIVKNPMDEKTVEHRTIRHVPGKPVAHYLSGVDGLHDPSALFIVFMDGQPVPASVLEKQSVDDNATIAVTVRVGFEAAAGLSTWVAGLLVGGSAAFSTAVAYSLAYGATFLATSFAIGYGMHTLASALGPDAPGAGGNEPPNAEATYGWTIQSNTVVEGTPKPVLYGKEHIRNSQIINWYTRINDNDEDLYVLLGLVDHEVDTIDNVKINDLAYTNYKGATIETRLGTLNDAVVDGFDDVVTQVAVNTQIEYQTELIVTTTGTAVDAADLLLTAPYGLFTILSDGSYQWTTVSFTVEYRETGSGDPWTTVQQDRGGTLYDTWQWTKSNTAAQRLSVAIDFPATDQYDIRIYRTTVDNNAATTKNITYLTAVNEIVRDVGMIYPGLAKLAVKIPASQDISGGMPRISCDVERATVPIWDESLATPAWTDKRATNYAWMVWHLLTERSPDIDKTKLVWADFKAWADHGDETVGGDYRFKGNLIIAEGNLWGKAQEIARMGRAVIVDRGGNTYGVFCDKQETAEPQHVFSHANILEGSFSLQYLEKKDAANAIQIEYTDPDRDYTRQTVTVANDYAAYANAQPSKKRIKASIPQAEAVRMGVHEMNSTNLLNRVVKFDAAFDSFRCIIGDLFYLQHGVLSYSDNPNQGGRIIDAGNDNGSGSPYVTFDHDLTVESGKTYAFRVRLKDDTLVEKYITSAPTTASTFVITTAWADVPEVDQLPPYALGIADNYDRVYRLTDVTRGDDSVRTLTGIEYIDAVYTNNDSLVLTEITEADPSGYASNVLANEVLVRVKDDFFSNLNVSWTGPLIGSISGAKVIQKFGVWVENLTLETDPVPVPIVSAGAFSFLASSTTIPYSYLNEGDQYKIYVNNIKEGPVDHSSNVYTITIQGKSTPPGDVTGLTSTWNTDTRTVTLSWDEVTDIDMSKYVIRRGSTWATADVVTVTGKENLTIDLPIKDNVSGSITFLVKAEDTTGNYSTNAASTTVSVDTALSPTYGATWGTNISNEPQDLADINAAEGEQIYQLTPSDNMLLNPDFELDMQGWEGVPSNIVSVSDGSYGGNALEVTNNDILLSTKYIPVDTAKTYYGEIWVKATVLDSVDGNVRFYVGIKNYDYQKNENTDDGSGGTRNANSYFITLNETKTSVDSEFLKYTGIISGEGVSATTQFAVGTKYVRFLVFCNYQNTYGATMQIAFCRFSEVEAGATLGAEFGVNISGGSTAANKVSNSGDITQITGGIVQTGAIQSTNWAAAAGMQIDLDNATITIRESDGLVIDSADGLTVEAGGNLNLTADVSGPGTIVFNSAGTNQVTMGMDNSDILSIAPSAKGKIALNFGNTPTWGVTDPNFKSIDMVCGPDGATYTDSYLRFEYNDATANAIQNYLYMNKDSIQINAYDASSAYNNSMGVEAASGEINLFCYEENTSTYNNIIQILRSGLSQYSIDMNKTTSFTNGIVYVNADSSDNRITFREDGVGTNLFSIGTDYSDTNKFKLCVGANLGTDDVIEIDSSGDVVSPNGSIFTFKTASTSAVDLIVLEGTSTIQNSSPQILFKMGLSGYTGYQCRIAPQNETFRIQNTNDSWSTTVTSLTASTTKLNVSVPFESYDGNIAIKEVAASPSNIPNYGQFYTKSDNEVYFMDGDGTEYTLNKTAV